MWGEVFFIVALLTLAACLWHLWRTARKDRAGRREPKGWAHAKATQQHATADSVLEAEVPTLGAEAEVDQPIAGKRPINMLSDAMNLSSVATKPARSVSKQLPPVVLNDTYRKRQTTAQKANTPTELPIISLSELQRNLQQGTRRRTRRDQRQNQATELPTIEAQDIRARLQQIQERNSALAANKVAAKPNSPAPVQTPALLKPPPLRATEQPTWTTPAVVSVESLPYEEPQIVDFSAHNHEPMANNPPIQPLSPLASRPHQEKESAEKVLTSPSPEEELKQEAADNDPTSPNRLEDVVPAAPPSQAVETAPMADPVHSDMPWQLIEEETTVAESVPAEVSWIQVETRPSELAPAVETVVDKAIDEEAFQTLANTPMSWTVLDQPEATPLSDTAETIDMPDVPAVSPEQDRVQELANSPMTWTVQDRAEALANTPLPWTVLSTGEALAHTPMPWTLLEGEEKSADDEALNHALAQTAASLEAENVAAAIPKERPVYDDTMLPGLGLLLAAEEAIPTLSSEEDMLERGIVIEEKLAEFKVKVSVVDAYAGPVITRYEIEPAVGVRGNQVVNLIKDLSRALGLASIRVVETIPGKTCMGLELPNPTRQMIRISEILSAEVFQQAKSSLTLVLGKDITGEPVVTDLAKAPHLLVAGTTGSGKSVGVNAMIASILYKATPDQVRFIMIDPKMLELSVYNDIPHLLAPVVTDMKLAANALNWCVGEMERRYRLMSALGVRNLAGYNEKLQEAQAAGQRLTNPFSLTPETPEPLDKLPFIVVVVDEFADLMMVAGKKIEELIARLAQKARAAGIHLILATQRPSVDVITGLIKANIPTRIAFQVSSKVDSRTILDQMGAESLLGQGDMLFLPPGSGYPQRVHGAFVTDDEVHAIVDWLKQFGEPDYVEGLLTGESEVDEEANAAKALAQASTESDPLYDDAVEVVMRTRKASISGVQRHLRIGYNRAARLIEEMEAAGIVSGMENNGNRTVLVPQREG